MRQAVKEGSRAARLAKEHQDSPRRIDAAVAASRPMTGAATLASVTRDSIYT
jgi:hypothetical protein